MPLKYRTEAIQQAPRALAQRCLCPECLRLDALYPGEGFQYALIAPSIAEITAWGKSSKF